MKYKLIYELESEDLELMEAIYELLWNQVVIFDELVSASMESVVDE